MLRRLTLTALAATALLALAAGPAAAAADKDCKDFDFQEDAQAYFDSRGGSASNNVDRLDGDDRDGIVCESLPRRGGAAAGDAGDGDPGGAGGESAGKELPFTGPTSTPLGIAAAALLVAGGGLLWRLRYRPSH